MTCEEALQMGLVSRTAPRAELEATVQELVESITSHSLIVTRLTKRAIRAGQSQTYSEALSQAEQIYLAELTKTEDMHEGLAAFVDKRAPQWNHR
jgi:enoyl-CoA hydratase/carnithine racemase